MRSLQNIGVAKRLGLIVGAGSVLLASLAGMNLHSQSTVATESKKITGIQQGLAALHHLDTRQSELKVDAYRSLLGQDVTGDVSDDVQSSTDAQDAVAASGLTPGLLASFAAIRADFTGFGDFITQFTKDAKEDRAAAVQRIDEIADKNHKTDDELGALTDQATAAAESQQKEMDS